MIRLQRTSYKPGEICRQAGTYALVSPLGQPMGQPFQRLYGQKFPSFPAPGYRYVPAS
ncbi:hypothetical protein Pse7367_0347 [Thalassoporum mexicanum PCC 7367]|uniref:hypothetical protein n=1 Tax=Thalassoporum mexicanum TaxID=3457544 RepID=UPI00029FF2E0|nr:hypothetical protein [Pseudanabaena sp. PCC 7367]AFY68658.1 hypothetical protein Pse7367_0347 [Pseudanabaena sp. PCC 7367]